jgi:hypothetical protein
MDPIAVLVLGAIDVFVRAVCVCARARVCVCVSVCVSAHVNANILCNIILQPWVAVNEKQS